MDIMILETGYKGIFVIKLVAPSNFKGKCDKLNQMKNFVFITYAIMESL